MTVNHQPKGHLMNNKKYILGLIATALVAEQVTLMRANRVIKKQHKTITTLCEGVHGFDAMLNEPDVFKREAMQANYRTESTFVHLTHKF